MSRKPNPKPSVKDYLGNTEGLVLSENGENKPLFIKFEFTPADSPDQIATDEAEVILAYDDGFAVPGISGVLPGKWRLTKPDPQGFALYKVPTEACIGFQHRKIRRRRYHGNVACRKLAA